MQIRPDAGSQGAERVRKAELQTMLFYCQEVVLPFREGGKERQCLQYTGGGVEVLQRFFMGLNRDKIA